jgi:hypothetical protein
VLRSFFSVRLPEQWTPVTGELCAITIPTEHLEFGRVAHLADPPPQPGSARAEIVFLAMAGPIAVHMVKLQKFNEGGATSWALAVRFAAAVVGENFVA